ncbi:MAG TPA: arsenate reductase ArsC [Pirellulales bacterium]|nr:arsenate reductase ArsC [Pirellulales bacterium]
MKKLNVLFLCTGNSCRSQMAEALLRAKHGDRFEAFSAGMEPKGIHPLTLQVLNEIGIDTSELRSKSVTEYLGKLWVHYLVIVCQNAAESCPRIFPGMVKRFFWPFDDPPAFQGTDLEKLEKFREVRAAIAAAIDDWVSDLEASGQLDSVVGGQVE